MAEIISQKEYDELIIMLHELKQMGYSNSFLATRLGINKNTFWYYTKGKRNCPKELFERIKDFLDHEKEFKNER